MFKKWISDFAAISLRDLLIIFFVVTLIVAADAILMFHFSKLLLGYNSILFEDLLVDFLLLLAVGLVGLVLARRSKLPLWWRKKSDEQASWKANLIAVLLGVAVVALTAAIYMISRDQASDMTTWLTILTPGTALAYSLRTVLVEELLFRLFLFSLIVGILLHVSYTRQSALITGALVSTIGFTLFHPSSFIIWTLFMGLALVYIYYQRGLIPAMVVHFSANFVSFFVLSAVG